MNNIEDSDGNIGSHIKLIRNESVGNYLWSGSSSNRSSDWTKSTLNTEVLNGTYYNNLNDNVKNMISNIVWNLGGRGNAKATANTFYTNERGTIVNAGQETKWTGKIGLMYPSDYGFAVGGNVRENCLEMNLGQYNENNCYTNNWINNGSVQWTLSPNNYKISFTLRNNVINWNGVYNYSNSVRPTLFLNSNINLSSGTGSSSDPFVLQTT